jgi:hypothetical protein
MGGLHELRGIDFDGAAFGRWSGAAGPRPVLDLVKQSVEALGGADALRAVKTLVVKADVKHWEPGQSYSING